MAKRKKTEFPLTAVLIAIVIVLIGVLSIVVIKFLDLSNAEYEEYQREQAQQESSLQAMESGEQKTSEQLAQKQEESELQSKKTETERISEKTEEETQMEKAESEKEIIDIAIESESEKSKAEQSVEQETEAEKLVVAIDPGHQGSWVDMSDTEPNGPGSSVMKRKATVGTEGRFSGKMEYELNLEISLLLRTELEKRGYEVILTREDHDTAISNAQRALLAYEQGGDIYVRIHANGDSNSSVSGALAMVPSPQNPYVAELSEDSYLLGQCILDAYCSETGFGSLGVQYYDDMTGINWSKLPVMILEMGFMTNESDDLRMADAEVQQQMAEGIADGIDDYFLQKGMKEERVSETDQKRMDTVVEILGESYIYPETDEAALWAVSIKDLNTGAAGDLNGDVQIKAASLMKLFIMGAIYDRVCYPSSSERYIYYPETYEGELKQLITDMITVSDNTAANTLVTTLGGGDAKEGMAVVNQFCQEQGYQATSMGRLFLEENPSGENYTSANDCRTFLERISKGSCVNEEASAKMLEYLRNQTYLTKIAEGLKAEAVSVANKTGELYGEYGEYVEHDAAILEQDGSVYVLCILTQSKEQKENTVGKIAELAKLAYQQLQQ